MKEERRGAILEVSEGYFAEMFDVLERRANALDIDVLESFIRLGKQAKKAKKLQETVYENISDAEELDNIFKEQELSFQTFYINIGLLVKILEPVMEQMETIVSKKFIIHDSDKYKI